MATPTTKVQIKFRTKWWQFWLPEHITLAIDTTPFDTLAKTTRVLQSQVTDLGDMVIFLNEELDTLRKADPIVQAFDDRSTPLQPLPEPVKHIPVLDIDTSDEDASDGGDWQPETSSNVVEFDRNASPSWTPDQSGSVVVKQPPIITQMRNNQRNDLRKLQQ